VRTRVLNATLDALLEHDVDALSVAEIAQRAGVHETSIYRRWGTRAGLALDAVLSRAQQQIPVPDKGSLREDLVTLLGAIAVFVSSPLGQLLLRMAMRQDLPEYEVARSKFWSERLALGSAVLERAAARGELRAGVDHQVVLETLVGPLHVRLLLTRQPLDETFLHDVVDLIVYGIGAQAPDRRTHNQSTRSSRRPATPR
jgi:AcrR family transcriptional regulator